MPTNAKKIRIGGVSHDIEDTQARSDISALKSNLNSYFTPPENYDRLTDKTYQKDSGFSADGKTIVSGGGIVFPMYIPVEPNTTYIGSGFNYYAQTRAFDADKEFVSNGITVDAKKITTGANTYFIRIAVNNNATASSVIFQKGTASSTITSLAQLSEDVTISDNKFKPFNLDNLTGNSKLAASAFSAFEIHCTDPSAQVKLTRVLRANSNVHAIVITVNGTSYNVLNAPSANYTEPSYNEFNLSNVVYGYFVIDWSKLTSGTAYNSIGAELKQTYIKPYVETPKYDEVEILLPEVINVAIGHQISLEYYNIIKCSNVEEFEIVSNQATSVFQNLGDRLKIEPTSAGETTLKLSAYKNNVLITEKTTTINAVADTQPQIKAIFIGDSMVDACIFIAELKHMLGTNLTLYGTRSSTAEDSSGNSQTVLHEGRPGWSSSDYVNSASKNGISNPFYNSGFDFSYYMTNNSTFNDVTDVFVLLGANDGASTTYIANIQSICESIKTYNSNIKIHVMLPIPPIRSGYAWGTRSYTNYMTFKGYMFDKAKQLITAYDSTNGYTIVPINANLNCYYDFPQTEVAVNSRNPQLIPVGNDNVHPSKYGYYRFADVVYSDIVANG